jgi:flagellar biogenesis protein FliO
LPQVSNTPVEKKSIAPATPGMDEFGRLLGYVTLLAALAGGAIYLIKFGIPLHRNRSKEERKLQVLEMRPLGNRQFLIVVGYEDTRMLLGVTPGKIDYLCALDSISTSAVDFSQLVDQSEKIRAAQ